MLLGLNLSKLLILLSSDIQLSHNYGKNKNDPLCTVFPTSVNEK